LKQVARVRATESKTPLRFAVVHPYSGHNYELRYWLAACGINPSRDIEIVIVPPPLMLDALGSGTIDGYCVGEPWNSAAALLGKGHIATVKAAIWRSSPEKVLAAGAHWAQENPEALSALLLALSNACKWCADARNHEHLAHLLAGKAYVGQPADWMLPELEGRLPVGAQRTVAVPDFFVPFAKAATFPWKSHALWFYSQMVRWGQVAHSAENAKTARETYRPDLYRAALKASGIALPVANAKVEGALTAPTPVGSSGASLVLGPDGFFDGGLFDPARLDAYIASQKQ
jgi:NitT/TauT family transport system ATP-binding protein